ncbi:MAG: ATP-binding protein [Methylococcales bacterium]
MRKLTFSLLIVVLVSVLGLSWTLDSLFERYSTQPSNDSLLPYQETGVFLARMLDLDDDPQSKVKTFNSESRLLLSLKPINEFSLPAALQAEFNTGKPLALESDNGITLNFHLPHNQKVLTLTSLEMSADEKNNPLSLIFTLLFYLGILALTLIWLYPLVKQLIKLRETAKVFGQGDLSQRVIHNSVSYISDIETEFNHMAQRIQLLVSDNKLLSSAVSHDLRTPLARLRFGIDTLSEESNPVLREKYQQRISQDIAEMESLVETLLDYACMEEAMIKLKKIPVDLGVLANHCILNFSENNKQLTINNTTTNSMILGDERYLSMLINNLLQNGYRHAQTKVHISLKSEKQNITLTVEDDGEGIHENERLSVLKPFIRGSNTKPSQGYGMGLSIAQRITDWHDGHLKITQSHTLGGAKLKIIFDCFRKI